MSELREQMSSWPDRGAETDAWGASTRSSLAVRGGSQSRKTEEHTPEPLAFYFHDTDS
ncbi:MAG: hypothetical protein AAGK00_12795 [Pseudomonadota bacterium]